MQTDFFEAAVLPPTSKAVAEAAPAAPLQQQGKNEMVLESLRPRPDTANHVVRMTSATLSPESNRSDSSRHPQTGKVCVRQVAPAPFHRDELLANWRRFLLAFVPAQPSERTVIGSG